ncbi:MAG TPA: MobF family relaxase [Opitutaceae bacterium]|jgi:conjugative relaxase-like TrwC/TraI family protein
MLRPKPQLNLQNAREYFREHLCVGDYYSEGKQVKGEWAGKAAEMLGLSGPVRERDFLALCDGLNPQSGGRLTQRRNTLRWEDGRQAANRRIFHDFTFSPPKSVSVVALCQDTRIVALHERSVRTALAELERFAETRVRRSRQESSRVTGNLAVACFRHDTSRELDPHLHTHCVAFNATFDSVEGRWKALQTEGMYRAQKFVENLYYHEMAKGLRGFGYQIENNARDFEIKGVSACVIARFSKRHDQIVAEARRQVAEGYSGDLGELRTRIAHEHRRRKVKNATADELRDYWRTQLEADECDGLRRLQSPAEAQRETMDVRAAVTWAEAHLFERRAVVNDYELMAAALARGRGHDFDLAALGRAVAERGYVRQDGSRKLTSRELLGFELEIVLAVRDGRNCFAGFNPDFEPDAALSAEQARAARRILTSEDFVTVFRGGAGTGKTRTIAEIQQGLAKAGHPVVVLAPQRQQAHDLESDGLPAQTLAHALAVRQLPPRAVVILDEAGQVGGRDLRELIRLVKAHDGRLILSGDTRQHGAVAASDALRAIEKHAHPRVATLRTVRRQDPRLARSIDERRFIRQYRAAVKEAADGKIVESFDRLEKMGCVRELPDEPRREAIAGEYLTALARGERPLVVAQTWSEVHSVNDAIRAALRANGQLADGASMATFHPVDRDEAQRCDPRFYEQGHWAAFLKGYGRFAKGELYEIAGADQHGVVLVKNGRRSTMSYRYVNRFTVAKAVEMELSPGDRLQLKANGRSVEGTKLRNGELVTVTRVEASGTLVVADERGETKTLARSQRLFVRGYAVTSYSSQGKTVDTVILADAGIRAATSGQQWYVGISRGRKRVVVLTPDKERLRLNIQRSGERDLAVDVVRADSIQVMHVPGRSHRTAEMIDLARMHQFVEQRERQGEQRGMRI